MFNCTTLLNANISKNFSFLRVPLLSNISYLLKISSIPWTSAFKSKRSSHSGSTDLKQVNLFIYPSFIENVLSYLLNSTSREYYICADFLTNSIKFGNTSLKPFGVHLSYSIDKTCAREFIKNMVKPQKYIFLWVIIEETTQLMQC